MIQVIDNLISLDCVKKLQDEFNTRPYIREQYRDTLYGKVLEYRNKHLNFHLPDDPVHKLLFPVVNQIFGWCDVEHGTFKESHFPVGLHVDTAEVFKTKQFYTTNNKRLGYVLMIPLSEHDCFQTVYFDWYGDAFPNFSMYDDEKPVLTSDFPNLDHLNAAARNFLLDKPLIKSVTWKLGSGIIWPRNQLHCSSNFYPTGMHKLAINIFV